jgi:peptidoglycan/LPS O-acetylase OafA/YrhL
MISGFVVFITLDKSACILDFLIRRVSRLLPAMITCSAIIFCVALVFPERPSGAPNLFSIIPGVTFIEPRWWYKILGFRFPLLEGAFWSLYVEVKFYLLASIIYFVFGRIWVPVVLGFLACIYSVFVLLEYHFFVKVLDVFSVSYFGWFAVGGVVYFSVTRCEKIWDLLFTIFLCSAILSSEYITNFSVVIYLFSLGILFLSAAKSKFIQDIFNSRLLVFVGVASYPLYLLHQNIFVSIVSASSSIPVEWLIIFLFVIIISMSYVLSKFIEPQYARYLYTLFNFRLNSKK